LASMIMIAMAKDPAARYHSTMEMLDAACAAVGLTSRHLPDRVTLTEADTGTVRVYPAQIAMAAPVIQSPPAGIPGTVRAPMPQDASRGTIPVYPPGGFDTRDYGEPVQQKQKTFIQSIPIWLWAIGGIIVLSMICGFVLLLAGLPIIREMIEAATPTPEWTNTPASEAAPSSTPLPTFAPQSTFTSQPTYTPLPTYTPPPPPTEAPPPTEPPPPPTEPPSLGNLIVRIRNRTGSDVNLYRIGTVGETHFLGWLVPNYYGEYPWPGLGTWVIQFCRRDNQGNSSNCRQKTINVTSSGQEFSVP
jgi:hypothetical protein